MIERIETLSNQVDTWSAQDLKELDDLRVKYLSKKGEISQLFNDFRSGPAKKIGRQKLKAQNKAQQLE